MKKNSKLLILLVLFETFCSCNFSKYDWVGDFYSDFQVVEINGKRGLINKNDEVVIPIEHENVLYIGSNNYFAVEDNGKTGIYNTKNKEIIPTIALYVKEVYNDKYFELKLPSNDENSVCLFNDKGEQITEAIFSRVVEIYEDFAIMNKIIEEPSNSYDKRSKFKIFDLKDKNNPLNKLPYYTDAILIKSQPNLLFQVKEGTTFGEETAIIDIKGKAIIPFGKYEYIWNFGENLFSVSVKGILRGYADKDGNLVIKPIFNDTEKFENGMAKVTLKEKIFYIDKSGKCVKDCPTQKWLDFHNITGFKINNTLYKELVEKGLIESKSEEYSNSIETFSKAIQENPLDYEGYHNRGLSYLMLNKLDEAEQDLDESIKYNPNYSDSYYLRGNVHQRRGSSYSAISDFEKAIELSPYNADSYMKCAIVYGKLGNRQKSCEYIKKACELGNYDACSAYSKFCE